MSQEKEIPKFAVVGHPNKGKSSIVSALAQDDSVAVSNIPGTTTKQKSYPLKIDGQTIYELIDTPGFQRARQVLQWLKSHEVSAAKRPDTIRKFMHTFRDDPIYRDEIALLRPIMDGAGILYVVDASKPYGEEYEAEMEILRWTGQPSMALLNHIDEDDYSQDWKVALNQYFRSVRSFNPMNIDIDRHIGILENIAQLNESWTQRVKTSIDHLKKHEEKKYEQSASIVADLIFNTLTHIEQFPISNDESTNEEKEELERKYKNYLRKLEENTHNKLEKIWKHNHLEVDESELHVENLDLFSEETASIFGLTRKELVLTGAGAGAMTGAGIDLLFAGHTLFAGGIIGAIIGGAGGYLGFDELSDIQVLGQKLGKKVLQMGPIKNRNFPYILLGRALYLIQKLSTRSHARREQMTLEYPQNFKEQWLDEERKKILEKLHKVIRNEDKADEKVIAQYREEIKKILSSFLLESKKEKKG